MTQLAKLQQTFQDCVLKPDPSVPSAWVSASGRATPETQLSIYSYAYRARLKEVLANDFPAVLMALGEEPFNHLADLYIEQHPSHYFSLRDFGSHLPNFISEVLQDKNSNSQWQQMPWLYELVLFEWNLGQAFDAADVDVFTEQDMIAVPPENWPDLSFVLHPSVRRLNFEWNIVEMWQALTGDNPAEVAATDDVSSPWLIWREQLNTRFRSMQAGEQRAFDQLKAGANFDEICDVLASIMSEDEVPMHAAGLLKSWIAQGLISGVK